MLRFTRRRILHPRTLRTPTPRRLHVSHPLQEESDYFDPAEIERAEDEVDVCIVGAGPAGLSAAIRLKQLEREKGNEIRVVVLEKGSEVGAHIVSGAVIEPRALNELLPSWQTAHPNHPLTQPATHSKMIYLTKSLSIPMPHPPQMDNTGNYIVSLSQFTRWLAGIAEEEYGVEIYPGFAGAQLLYSKEEDSVDPWGTPTRSVQGVVTNEVGLTRTFRKKASFEPGMAFRSKVTLLAEGAHGSLSKQAISRYKLRKEAQPQTYGIGLKEVWRVDPEQYRPGEVVHTMGKPLDWQTYGGGWVYHMDDGLVSLGLVIGLDYKNPYLSPYREFQSMKHHPYFRTLLSGSSTRLSYAARVLNEGGLQAIPKLHFPGGALIGCSAGFVNIAKIKGTHNAMKSGMLAAEAAYEAVAGRTDAEATEESTSASEAQATEGRAVDMKSYDTNLRKSWIWDDLYEVRNLRPSFDTALGIWGGVAYSGVDTLFLKGRVPWTFKHSVEGEDTLTSYDSSHTDSSRQHKPIEYPAFEPPLSTDLMTSVALTGTNHAEDQPVHLRVVKTKNFMDQLDVTEAGKEGNVAVGAGSAAQPSAFEKDELKCRREHVKRNVEDYAGLLGHACPAGVYEYVEAQDGEGEKEGWGGKKLVINSQNCIHCKLCDVKVPSQDITWTVPEGGGGPKYTLT
ncbi:hypothetical protein BDQ17DRAFT_1285707 [Cyathus striatus]|nr:hypothetical protein BDQ17DRAFT_1285707 [Cyathus striatus]